MCIRGNKLEVVSSFKYLGCISTSDVTIDAEIGLLQRKLLFFACVQLRFGPQGLCHVLPNSVFFQSFVSVAVCGRDLDLVLQAATVHL